MVHFNGAPTTDVRSRISGSKALRDASRSVLVCGVDPGDESRFVLVQDKNSFGPRPTTGRAYRIEAHHVEHQGETFTTSGIVWCGDVEIDSRGLLAGPDDPEERDGIQEAMDSLNDLVEAGDGRVDAAEAKKAAPSIGVSEKTMQRARRRVGLVVEREGFGKGATYWWCKSDTSDSSMVDKGAEPEPEAEAVHHGETVAAQGGSPISTPMVDTTPRLSSMAPLPDDDQEDVVPCDQPTDPDLAAAWREDREGRPDLDLERATALLVEQLDAEVIETIEQDQ